MLKLFLKKWIINRIATAKIHEKYFTNYSAKTTHCFTVHTSFIRYNLHINGDNSCYVIM